jgi:hypothetical protein
MEAAIPSVLDRRSIWSFIGNGIHLAYPYSELLLRCTDSCAIWKPLIVAFVFGLFGMARSALLCPSVARFAKPHQAQLLINYVALTVPIVRQVNSFVLAVLGSFVVFTYLANI